jgi:hypothetical protein
MMRSNPVIPHVVSWLLRGSACLGAAIAGGCIVEDAPGADELVEEVDDMEFRDNGCGADFKSGTASQTCKYQSKKSSSQTVKASCPAANKLQCEYEHLYCGWQSTSTTTCSSKEPACAPGPNIAPIKLTHTFTLTGIDDVCEDPDENVSLQVREYNRKNRCDAYLNALNINGTNKTSQQTMEAQCLANTTPDVTKDVTCCIPKAGGSSDGDSGAGCESSGTTGGDATSWGELTTSDDGGEATAGTVGESGESGAGESGAGESGVGESGPGDPGDGECPPGSFWQCSAGFGDAPPMCTCAVPAPLW